MFLQDRDQGGRFLKMNAGQRLGGLMRDAMPEYAKFVSSECREEVLQPGSAIRIVKGTKANLLDCKFSPMPERFRHLLGMRLNINRATEEELCMLPGIGPSLATRILTERRKRGSFTKPDNLLHVQGIGPKLMNRIADYVCTSCGQEEGRHGFSRNSGSETSL